jgi:hypothetical protein
MKVVKTASVLLALSPTSSQDPIVGITMQEKLVNTYARSRPNYSGAEEFDIHADFSCPFVIM